MGSGNARASSASWIAHRTSISTASARSGWKRWSRGRVALVGDAAFCVSLMAGQGSALAMTAAYVLAGELANSNGRHEEAFGKYEALLREYIGAKQQGAELFCLRLCAKDRMGPVRAQSSDKDVRNSGAGKAYVRQRYHRHPATSRLPLASTCINRQPKQSLGLRGKVLRTICCVQGLYRVSSLFVYGPR